MAEVKILVKGYVSADTRGRACSTVVLVRDGKIKMVIDPGTVRNPQELVKKLKNEKLSPADVNWVCITHSHMDHYRNIGMFPKAKTLDYWGVWEADNSWKLKGGRLTENIRVIKTPGHSYDGITLLVKTSEGVVAVCGDVFWKENFPKKDKYATDAKKLGESRARVLKEADFIIPGHGGIYRVRKGSKQA